VGVAIVVAFFLEIAALRRKIGLEMTRHVACANQRAKSGKPLPNEPVPGALSIIEQHASKGCQKCDI